MQIAQNRELYNLRMSKRDLERSRNKKKMFFAAGGSLGAENHMLKKYATKIAKVCKNDANRSRGFKINKEK